ncbi:50S ribosomal protein L6 [Marinihelvus fidelis]|uniref:Large ribosomal subunit protein uL6 n=1 Tax=Marinihelvus fidelis TaxID=2613842 RepID=A0A5N0T9U7_9GAMM|nr:50S ribosomal protein L6 [Marinihelvus fidelis]KAA9131795.1 50S ribosomal protein L6 [Marinihelvus fidelis]
MSRVANNPITIPQGVDFNVDGQQVRVKGPKGNMALDLHPSISLEMGEGDCSVKWSSKKDVAMAGTFRALLNNMVLGVSEGFERKLTLVGVGYRAQAQGTKLNLQLGFSHPIDYDMPEGVSVETPTQTEIVLKGCDKQRVGQAAAEIRAFRPPEPYKGKGVRYSDERVVRKEAKKA